MVDEVFMDEIMDSILEESEDDHILWCPECGDSMESKAECCRCGYEASGLSAPVQQNPSNQRPDQETK